MSAVTCKTRILTAATHMPLPLFQVRTAWAFHQCRRKRNSQRCAKTRSRNQTRTLRNKRKKKLDMRNGHPLIAERKDC